MREDDISPKTKSIEIPFKFHWDESFIFRWDESFIFRWVPFIFRWDSLRFRKIPLRFVWDSSDIFFQIPVRFSYIPFRLCWNSVEIPFTITSDELINWINRQKDQNRSQILKIKKISKKREYNKFIETRLLWRFFRGLFVYLNRCIFKNNHCLHFLRATIFIMIVHKASIGSC